jgi:hypothetical protein
MRETLESRSEFRRGAIAESRVALSPFDGYRFWLICHVNPLPSVHSGKTGGGVAFSLFWYKPGTFLTL